MKAFHLKIVTPDGVQFDGAAEQLTVRTTTGDVGILAGHINYVAPLGMGEATILADGQKRFGACIGGMLSVTDGNVTLLPTTFEWADQIDVERVHNSEERAQKMLERKDASSTDILLAQARLKRALVRKNVSARRMK